jgi:hypothetical protein
LHRHKLLEAFKNKQERDAAVQKLPPATEKERAVLRKAAKKLIAAEPVNYKELETRVAEDLQSISLTPQPNHLDWLLYYLRVEAHLQAEALAQQLEDDDLMMALLTALME